MASQPLNDAKRPSIVQIVARLPPSVDGVGDYSWNVASELRSGFGIDSRFLVCSNPHYVPPSHTAARVSILHERSKEAFLASLRGLLDAGDTWPIIVLHYAGYGYERNGTPYWMIEGLEDIAISRPRVSVVAIFHELFARSMPWRRAFWYSNEQKSLVKRLIKISAAAMCTIGKNERYLQSWSPQSNIARIAIPSNVGEPPAGAISAWLERRNEIVVFGMAHTRELAYRQWASLEGFCRQFGIARIVDIGPAVSKTVKVPAVAVEHFGIIPAAQISQVLLGCRFGFLYYPAEYLAKSGIFAAYCSHGLTPVVSMPRQLDCDGLVAGRHYVVAHDVAGRGAADFEMIANEAGKWYASHDVAAHASWLAKACRKLA